MSNEDTISMAELAEVNPKVDLRGLRDDTPVSFIPMSDVTEGGQWINHQERRLDEARFGYTPFAEDDVLFAKITPCMENGKGAHAVCLKNGVGFGSTEFHVLRARGDTSARYLFHWFQARSTRTRAIAYMGGSAGQQRVQSDFFINFRVHRLDPAEQFRIAAVLDTVDEAIAKTKAVIAKLRQVRAGLLHDLLTRGLDKHGQLRDPIAHPEQFQPSPLGQIPKEWDTEPLEDCCSHVIDCPHSTPTYLTNGALVARTMHVRDGQYDVQSSSRVTEAEYRERIARLEPEPGDVIFTREAPVGEAFVIPLGMRVCLGQRVMLLRPRKDKLVGGFLIAQIYSGAVRQRIERLTGGTTNPHLNVDEVRAFTIPLPPVEEQERISMRLSALDVLLESETGNLNKLHKVKSGLMTDLLTGRARVPPQGATA